MNEIVVFYTCNFRVLEMEALGEKPSYDRLTTSFFWNARDFVPSTHAALAT